MYYLQLLKNIRPLIRKLGGLPPTERSIKQKKRPTKYHIHTQPHIYLSGGRLPSFIWGKPPFNLQELRLETHTIKPRPEDCLSYHTSVEFITFFFSMVVSPNVLLRHSSKPFVPLSMLIFNKGSITPIYKLQQRSCPSSENFIPSFHS